MIRLRELSKDELIQFGINNATMFVAEDEEKQVGSIVLGGLDGTPFACDLKVVPEFPEVAAMLVQKVRKISKSLGHERTMFSIDPTNPALMPLVLSGKARIELLWVTVNS